MRSLLFIFLTVFLFVVGCGVETPPSALNYGNAVSWRSLLADASSLTQWVDEESVLRDAYLFSSSIDSGGVALGSFSVEKYGDLDHGCFRSVREVDSTFEAVLAEKTGSGAVTWIWSANPVGELVLEVDGREFIMSFQSFLDGEWLPVRYPFSARTAGGFNLHFPIVHKTHCRISVRAKTRAELGALFYQVAWNAIGADCEVESFDMDGIRQEKAVLKQLARRQLHLPKESLSEAFEGKLSAGDSFDVVSLPGMGTIRCVEISAESKRQLSDLHFEAYWGGEDRPSLSCPLHFLCGVSGRFENGHSLPATVNRSVAILRWPMPFSNGARIRLKNVGYKDAFVKVSISSDRVLVSDVRLQGQLSEYCNLQLDQPNVLVLADVPSAGKFVGCVLQVENRSNGWWGEGDPDLWLDGRPAWRGTGTEDYFGFAWCSRSEFQHPFRGQSRASRSSVLLYRWHLLDILPFSESARFEFEAHGMGTGSMDYSALVLWYAATRPIKDWNALR
jgi:hypothetical protein